MFDTEIGAAWAVVAGDLCGVVGLLPGEFVVRIVGDTAATLAGRDLRQSVEVGGIDLIARFITTIATIATNATNATISINANATIPSSPPFHSSSVGFSLTNHQ